MSPTTTVPGGVDHTLIVIKCVRTAGTDNDGMVDSLSLVLS